MTPLRNGTKVTEITSHHFHQTKGADRSPFSMALDGKVGRGEKAFSALTLSNTHTKDGFYLVS